MVFLSVNNRNIAGTEKSSADAGTIDGWRWNDIMKQRVPDFDGGNRKGSATDGR